MATSLKAKLFAAASADTGLQALLLAGSPAIFRWYDTQLVQGTAFPAVVAFIVSDPKAYVMAGKLPTSFARVQLTVYGSGNDSENASAVVAAITDFLATFNAIGISGLAVYPNMIVGDRDSGIAQTDPLTYTRVLDVMIFNNDTV